jgi:glycosyltransferase involved in cell wall biosynthesis
MPYKVLFLSHDAQGAGAEIALSRFIAGLDRARFSPIVVIPQHGPLENVLVEQNIPYVFIPYFTTMVKELTDPVILKQAGAIREAIVNIAPDLIVINTVTIPHAIIAALTTDIPIIVHAREFIDQQQFALLPANTRLFEEIWLQFPETLVTNSHWSAQLYQVLLGREIQVIPNFVALPMPSPRPTIPHIVMLASLDDPNKRPDLFISAAALIHEDFPTLNFRCTLYGKSKPETIERMNKMIAEHRLEGVFSLQPYVEDIALIYQNSTIVFVASDVEAFSLVVIEAGAYKRPVVATRCGGPDELIIDGETGFLIDVGDSNAAAKQLGFLVQNPEVAHRMGLAARNRVEAYFSEQVVMTHYQQLLQDTISNQLESAIQRRIGNPIARYFMGLGH